MKGLCAIVRFKSPLVGSISVKYPVQSTAVLLTLAPHVEAQDSFEPSDREIRSYSRSKEWAELVVACMVELVDADIVADTTAGRADDMVQLGHNCVVGRAFEGDLGEEGTVLSCIFGVIVVAGD